MKHYVVLLLILCMYQTSFTQFDITGENAMIHESVISDDPDIGIQLIPEEHCTNTPNLLGISIIRKVVNDPDFTGDSTASKKSAPCNDSSQGDTNLCLVPKNFSDNQTFSSSLGDFQNRWSNIYTERLNLSGTGFMKGLHVSGPNNETLLSVSSNGKLIAKELNDRYSTLGSCTLHYDKTTGEIFALSDSDLHDPNQSSSTQDILSNLISRLDKQKALIQELKKENEDIKSELASQ